MKKLNRIVARGIITVLICMPVLSEQDDDACCDGELVDIPIQESNSTLKYVKEALPDLHLMVTSADWESKDGLVQLQTIIKPTMNAWGMTAEKIDKLMARIERYESNIPFDSKSNVKMVFGLVGDSLLMNFSAIERQKEGFDVFYDAYSLIYSDTYPDALEEYKKCLEQSVQRVITKSKLVFRDWVDTLEEGSSDSDFFMTNVSAHQKIAIELVELDMDYPEGLNVCHAHHLEHAQDLMFGDQR